MESEPRYCEYVDCCAVLMRNPGERESNFSRRRFCDGSCRTNQQNIDRYGYRSLNPTPEENRQSSGGGKAGLV